MKTEGLRGARVRRVSAFATTALVLAALGPAALADSYDGGGFESFALGTPLGQNGWTAKDTGAYLATNFDIEVVDPSATWGSALGSRALRISNAATSGGFGSQLQSASLVNEAGESGATASLNAGGTRQSRLSGTITFASATQAYQPGLAFSFAPDAGDGTRMANFRILDEAGGFTVQVMTLDESIPNFVTTTIATGLSHTEVHTLQFTLDFVEGVNNDVLWVKVGNAGCATFVASGSWEQYHRFHAGNATPITFTADSILFRVSGTPQPTLAGAGLLFDEFTLETSTVPAMPGPGVVSPLGAPTATVTGQRIAVAATAPTTNACQPVTAYRATLAPAGGGTPVVLTSATPNFDFDAVPAGSYAVTVAVTNAAGTSAESAPANAVVDVAAAAPTATPTPSPSPSISTSPSAEPEEDEDAEGGGDPESGGAESGGDDELAATGPTLVPLTLAALGLVVAGFAVRRRSA